MRTSRLLALLLLVAGLGLAGAAPADAHTDITRTDPGSGQQLDAAPGDVTLTFTGAVLQLGTQVQVLGPSGQVTDGKPRVDGSVVTQPLKSGMADGTYVVNWRSVASDGHPFGGTFTFLVGQAAPGTTATPTTPPTTQAPVSEHEHGGTPAPSSDDSDGIAGVAYVLGIIALAGILALAVLFERRRGRS